MRPAVVTVPSLIVAALLAPPLASALEIAEGFTVDGYGETFLRGEHRDANHPRRLADGGGDTRLDSVSDLTLRLGYVRDDVTLRADVIAATEPQFGDTVLLEQVFIDWRFDLRWTARAGRFQTTWLGWEGFHTPELWRVNQSAAWDWNVANHGLGPARPFVSDGAGVRWQAEDTPLALEGYVVDDVLGDGPGQDGGDKGIGGAATYDMVDVGRFELGMAYDRNAVNNGTVSASDAFAVDLNADITAFTARGWFFAAQVQIHRHPDLTITGQRYGNDLVALAMANWNFRPGSMSGTVMIDYVERGSAAGDNEVVEFALALLTRPRKHVQLNAETFYWAESGRDADSCGAAAVLLVRLP